MKAMLQRIIDMDNGLASDYARAHVEPELDIAPDAAPGASMLSVGQEPQATKYPSSTADMNSSGLLRQTRSAAGGVASTPSGVTILYEKPKPRSWADVKAEALLNLDDFKSLKRKSGYMGVKLKSNGKYEAILRVCEMTKRHLGPQFEL